MWAHAITIKPIAGIPLSWLCWRNIYALRDDRVFIYDKTCYVRNRINRLKHNLVFIIRMEEEKIPKEIPIWPTFHTLFIFAFASCPNTGPSTLLIQRCVYVPLIGCAEFKLTCLLLFFTKIDNFFGSFFLTSKFK